VSLAQLLNSSDSSSLGHGLLSSENVKLHVQARRCVTCYECGVGHGDLSQSTAVTSAGVSGFGRRTTL